MNRFDNLTRSDEFLYFFENFFVSAILAIMGIRLFLKITNYPQVGSHNLHIAHILWGGGLMMVALILLLVFLNNSTKRLAAIIGGLGFGTFIDELGKIITRDNNYFYQPTFSLIYIIFISLYLLFYALGRYWQYSPKEYLINSLEYLKEAVINDLDFAEKALALSYLDRADQQSPITKTVRELYQKLEAIPRDKPSVVSHIKDLAKNLYRNLIKQKWFANVFNLFFVFQFIVSVRVVALSILTVAALFVGSKISLVNLPISTIEIIDLFASAIAGFFIIYGAIKMQSSRLEAYQMFKRSLLVSIFLVQVFSFYTEQLTAFIGLIFNILILTTLNYFIDQEKTIAKK